jgi:hypothetical protein
VTAPDQHVKAMNLLWSYAYARNMAMDEFLGGLPVRRMRFFADSGAHSARTLGIHLDLDSYAAWIKKWAPWFTIYANLDVIGAAQATWDNQQRLEQDHGLHPMPVFHTGETWDVLERYLEAGYTYIALGKLLGNSKNDLRPWLAKCFRLAEGRAVFHGFGLTVFSMLKEFPFYSVDSSTWGSGVRFGYLSLFHAGRWTKISLRNRADVLANRQLLDRYSIPITALSAKGFDRNVVAGACAAAVYRAADWVRRIHGPIALPPGKGYPPRRADRPAKVLDATGPGLSVYLAEGTDTGHRRHAGGLHLYLADSSKRWTAAAARSITRETR